MGGYLPVKPLERLSLNILRYAEPLCNPALHYRSNWMFWMRNGSVKQTLERPTPIVGHRSDHCKQGLLISLSPPVVWFSAWMRSISPRYGFWAGSWVHKRAWNAPERHVLRRRIWLAWHAWAWIASSRHYTWAWLALSKHCVCWNSQLNLFVLNSLLNSCMFKLKYKYTHINLQILLILQSKIKVPQGC